jgi:hypothetical protein
MHYMIFDIKVGGYTLNAVERVTVKRAVNTLSNTATITMPGTVFNKALDIESKIKTEDKVTIKLGYDEQLETEFEGYLTNIQTDNGVIKLECEDDLYLFRKSVKDKEFAAGEGSVKKILEYLVGEVGAGLSIESTFDVEYEKFVIRNQTGHEVLRKIQNELKPNIYVREGKLQVHSGGTENYGSANYDFSKNIESDNLKYRSETERKIKVMIESRDIEGKTITGEAGEDGGDRINRSIWGMNEANLAKVAKEELARRKFEGLDGSFRTWLVPFCDAGFRAKIKDEDYPQKDGTYYVTAVETDFSKAGGVRNISLGEKVG